MNKQEFLDFVVKYRGFRQKILAEQTVDVLGLGPVKVGYNDASRRHYFELVNENRRPVVLGDLR